MQERPLMAGIEKLVTAYERFVKLPWDPNVAGAQRVWFAVYAPSEERRLRARLAAFEAATLSSGHAWKQLDMTAEFAAWLAAQEYREAYFDAPEDLEPALDYFRQSLAATVTAALTAPGVTDTTVVAISGIASLFGVARVSQLIDDVSGDIRGRLLVMFPGERDGSRYRLLDARDGWNYHAIPITAEEG
jgi:hypothetical protein